MCYILNITTLHTITADFCYVYILLSTEHFWNHAYLTKVLLYHILKKLINSTVCSIWYTFPRNCVVSVQHISFNRPKYATFKKKKVVQFLKIYINVSNNFLNTDFIKFCERTKLKIPHNADTQNNISSIRLVQQINTTSNTVSDIWMITEH